MFIHVNLSYHKISLVHFQVPKRGRRKLAKAAAFACTYTARLSTYGGNKLRQSCKMLKSHNATCVYKGGAG